MSWSIYAIRHRESGVSYYGRTQNPTQRWKTRRARLRCGSHHNVKLQAAWQSASPEDFEFAVLEADLSDDASQALEESLIARAIADGVAFNICLGSYGGDALTHHPRRDEEFAIRTGILQRHRESLTPEQSFALHSKPGALNPMYGRTHTAEARRRISDAHRGNKHVLGHKLSAERRHAISERAKQRVGPKNSFFGRRHSEETKLILAEKSRGKIPTNARPVRIGDVVYASVTAAATAIGVTPAAVVYRARSRHWPDHNYVTNECLTTIERSSEAASK